MGAIRAGEGSWEPVWFGETLRAGTEQWRETRRPRMGSVVDIEAQADTVALDERAVRQFLRWEAKGCVGCH